MTDATNTQTEQQPTAQDSERKRRLVVSEYVTLDGINEEERP
jgi:hypothetical protein